MGLVLSVRVGEAVAVGDDLVSLRSINREDREAIIRVNGGQPLKITTQDAAEIRSEVSVQISKGEFEHRSAGQRCRLIISAPKDVPILRQAIVGEEE